MAQPISLLGVDVPCIEAYWSTAESGEKAGTVLIPLFQKGILLLGPLVNLDIVRAERGELVALPLKVDGVWSERTTSPLAIDLLHPPDKPVGFRMMVLRPNGIF